MRLDKGLSIINIKELIKDVKEVCKECNCSYDYHLDGLVVVKVKGHDRDYDEGYYFIELFEEKFKDKYDSIIKKLWNTDELHSEGRIYSIDLGECFDLVMNGNSVVVNNLIRISASKEEIIKKLKSMYLTTCRCLGAEDTDGELKNSLKISSNSQFVRIKVNCVDYETSKLFASTWYDCVHNELFNKENTFDLEGLLEMFEENITVLEDSVVLTGWVGLKEE